MIDWLGGTIGNYRIEAVLGSGGMGRVFRAVHIHINRVAAVKVLRDQIAVDPTFQARFLREAQAVAALHHPNIVDILDFNEDKGVFYLVMEYVPDGSVRTLLTRHRESGEPLPLAVGLELIVQSADALDYAHRQGMVHRDIKPDNLLLKRDPETGAYIVKVADFGLARLGDSATLTVEGQAMGTPAYMSPEQCQGLNVDGRGDLYSLGVVLYEIATGAQPFVMKSLTDAIYKHVYVAPPSPLEVRPGLSEELSGIILRCLEKDPDARYATAGELAEALRRLIRTGVEDAPHSLAPTFVEPVAGAVTPVVALRVVLDSGEISLSPGEASLLTVTLVNHGQTPVQASVSVEGVPEEWISTPGRDVEIAPGAQVSGPLRVQVPAGAESRSGGYPVTVRAVAREDPAAWAEATTRLIVQAAKAGSLALVPAVASGRRTASYRIELRNDGSEPLEMAPAVYAEPGELHFAIDPASVVVGPGQMAATGLTVTGRDRWFGMGSRTHHFQVGAAGAGQPPGRLPPVDGRFVQQLAMPFWLPPLYALLALLALAALAYGLLRPDDDGDDDDAIAGVATETARALATNPTTGNPTGTATTASASDPTATVVVVVDPDETPTEADAEAETPTEASAVTETPTGEAVEVTETPATFAPTEVILFATGRNFDDPAGTLDIYVMNPDGSDQRPLISEPDDDWLASFSPDGSRVVWVSRRHGNHQLYLALADGSGVRRLTTSGGDDLFPRWSPNGTDIVFSRNEDGDDELYIVNADDGSLRRLTDNSVYDGFAAWSPDGSRIAGTSEIGGSNEIFVLDVTVEGSEPQRLTDDPASDFNPVWSPDGTQLIFISNRAGDNDIYHIDADGSDIFPVASDAADEIAPAWSPDGSRIAFCRKTETACDIHVVEISSLGETLIVSGASPNDPAITWSPDSSQLAYLSESAGNYDIWAVALDGSPPRQLTTAPGNDANLSWFAPGS